MKGLIDIYKIKDLHNGLGQFSQHLYLNLVEKKMKDLELDFLVPGHPSVPLKSAPSIGYIKGNFRRRYFPGLNQTYDFWHSVQQFPSFLPNKHTPLILTIHDLNFLVEKDKSRAIWYLKRLQKNVNRANYITTISNFTKTEIEKHVDLKGKNIQVIHNGISPNQHIEGKKPGFISGRNFFFSIGEFKIKKNFHALIPMMKYFPDHQLVIAGNHHSPYGKSILDEINQMGLSHQIVLPGKITEHEKKWLYCNCQAFLFPSMAEGFGMPAIEAMQEGKPTFLSKYTSLPEVGGDKAMYFNTFDAEDMAIMINRELNEFYANLPVRASEVIAYSQKFNWDKCAKEYLDLYQRVVQNR